MIFESECEKALCHCDQEKITQVINHIISNSIKFSNNKLIRIILSKDFLIDKAGKLLEAFKISIEDQGIGIPSGEEDEIFNKFAQTSRTKSHEGASGLSLALCSEIITAHKGKIWADNKIKSKTTINFIIPKSSEE
ncbi:MAG: hypothetical protein EOP34_08245 [Rickettsiales bacterium]|nr:MAG: hypothetical protein EOP34_08245 [Rickettsiales bacterium]